MSDNDAPRDIEVTKSPEAVRPWVKLTLLPNLSVSIESPNQPSWVVEMVLQAALAHIQRIRQLEVDKNPAFQPRIVSGANHVADRGHIPFDGR